jgi:hypothetical protein
MLQLRPYQPSDADTILRWIKDEDTFRKWSADRYPHYPITAADMNHKYIDCHGDCASADHFFPMTAVDEQGIGTALVQKLHETAGGKDNIIMYTCFNENAYGFYEKLGMQKPNDVVVLNQAEWTDFTVV